MGFLNIKFNIPGLDKNYCSRLGLFSNISPSKSVSNEHSLKTVGRTKSNPKSLKIVATLAH